MTTRIWLDRHGEVFEAPADARTCEDAEGRPRTHGLWKPEDPNVLVPLTLCGQPAGAIPGHGDIDCPDCLAVEQGSVSQRLTIDGRQDTNGSRSIRESSHESF